MDHEQLIWEITSSLIVSHTAVIISALWAMSMLTRVLVRRPSAFPHTWIVYAVLAWFVAEVLVHAAHLVVVFTRTNVLIMVVFTAVDAAASVMAILCIRVAYHGYIKTPSIKEYQLANSVLAQAVSDLSEKEPSGK